MTLQVYDRGHFPLPHKSIHAMPSQPQSEHYHSLTKKGHGDRKYWIMECTVAHKIHYRWMVTVCYIHALYVLGIIMQSATFCEWSNTCIVHNNI